MTKEKKKSHALAQQRYAKKQPPEWEVWRNMKRRCFDPSQISYPYYGARGIRVCERWREHGKGFKNFMEDMGPRPSEEFHLDRVDPDKDYCKENCQWSHRSENCARSRGCFGNREPGDDFEESSDEIPTDAELEPKEEAPF